MSHRLVQTPASHTPHRSTETVPQRLRRKMRSAHELDAGRMNRQYGLTTFGITLEDAEWLLAHLPQAAIDDVA